MMFTHGNSIVFQGYECDFVKIEELDKPQYKELGYVDHPSELTDDELIPESLAEPELTDDELRAEAKEAGITSWHVKGIDTLRQELGYDN